MEINKTYFLFSFENIFLIKHLISAINYIEDSFTNKKKN